MRLLIIEDDYLLRTRIEERARAAGFVVDLADNGVEGEYLGDEFDYDAVILDLGLPHRDGLTVLRHWRERERLLPVLILTARDAWFEKVSGFNAGADDYLAKPFHMEELIARLQALVRRGGGQQGNTLAWGPLRLYSDQRSVQVDSDPPQTLSRIEYRLLHLFLTHPERIWSKDQIAEHLYDDQTEHDSNVVEAHIRRLRRKIGQDRIQTLRGLGYRLQAMDKQGSEPCAPPASG